MLERAVEGGRCSLNQQLSTGTFGKLAQERRRVEDRICRRQPNARSRFERRPLAPGPRGSQWLSAWMSSQNVNMLARSDGRRAPTALRAARWRSFSGPPATLLLVSRARSMLKGTSSIVRSSIS